ncbi:hypothetical protein GCM10009737_22130 [Nocardioides lentus]|uniref:Polysaccharide chain length determinant N-terminal domain-containing protein n=1 Tax=Nocardioides lentus TaxID=338077 RepID=A0ABN2PG14_9ACTN
MREESPEDRGPVAAVASDLSRHRWFVLAVVVLALAAAVAATVLTPTTYTGRSSLIVSSNNRSPDQDAVLVQGYVDLFDDAAYQAQLLDDAGVEEPVELSARAAAASPILVISSTADDPEVARVSAAAAARAFQADINDVRATEQEAKIAELQNRIDARRSTDGDDSGTVNALRTELIRLEADRTDQLQELQLDAGVATEAPSVVRNVGLGLVGGLLLGVVLAVLLGGRRRRRGTSR